MRGEGFPRKSLADWSELARAELKGAAAESLVHETPEGIALKPLYTAADLEGLEDLDSLPGFAPFTRGVRASLYANRPWTVRQYAGFSTAEESNAFYRANLAKGQKGLSVAFDLPTHRGYDSDHPRAAADVGKAGVAIDSLEDMQRLFAGIPLEQTSVSMTMNGAVLPVLAAFILAGEAQGVAPEKLSGTIQNDILKEFMVRNTYIYPPAPSLRIVGDVIEFAARRMKRFNAISISGYHMQEAGATAAQELAFTLADGLDYVRAALKRGLAIDDFAKHLSFFFAVGMNFFMEIAKLRAARLLWARLLRPFAPRDPQSLALRMHCQTSGVSLQALDPYNNVVRTAIEALAAVLGGTQSLHTNAFDEALALPTPASAALARNTQLILREETDVTRVVDPLGGSYFVESLTASLAAAAQELIDEIEAAGGMTKALAAGMPNRLIEAAAVRRQARIDRGLDVIVGVNKYRSEEDAGGIETLDIDNAKVRRQQIERLRALKAARDDGAVAAALAALSRAAAEESGNLLELSIAAMRARATVGEVSAALETVYGRHRPEARGAAGLYGAFWRDDAEFQALRETAAAFAREAGRKPAILVAKLGQDGHDRGAKVIAAAFADIGFEVELGPLFQAPEEVARQAVEKRVHVVGISSQAAGHRLLVPLLLDALRRGGGEDIAVVLGGIVPEADRAALQAAGVAAIFGPGTHIPRAAEEILALIRRRQRSPGEAIS